MIGYMGAARLMKIAQQIAVSVAAVVIGRLIYDEIKKQRGE